MQEEEPHEAPSDEGICGICGHHVAIHVVGFSALENEHVAGHVRKHKTREPEATEPHDKFLSHRRFEK